MKRIRSYKQGAVRAGFTIVELLIVVVVIAILAAISVVAYTGIQNRAYDSAVQSDMTTIIKELELAKVDLGHYPRSYSEFPKGFKFSKSAYDDTANNIYYIVDIQNDRYVFALRSKTRKGYIINTGEKSLNVGTVHSGIAAEALGIPWEITPDVSWVTQGYSGSSSNWYGGWSWTS